ncbi:MAG: PEP-CTERM sorting domain-containing protein [Thiobacillus sp.]|nr:PEP-CTERM sorting domain-containing protein [Thiobacillus sp.]
MNFKLATLAAALIVATPAFADTLNGPNPYAAGFGFDTPTEASWGGWDRGDANTLYAEWDTISDATYGTSNDRTAAPTLGASGASNTYLGWNSGTFVAGTGNLYNFSAAEIFQIKAEGGPTSGPVRAVLQTEGWGTDFDLATIMLNGVAPTVSTVTFQDPAYNSSFGVVTLTQRLFYWDLASTPTSYTFGLATAAPHMSFAQVAVDIAAAPVPEPETYAMLLAGLGLVGWQARRRNKAAQAVAA